ncbi:GPI-anchored protein LLG3-like [Salvia miltiorrhiza]|uniref:GPI-anchored protein LLG3-like n=1 Tax=Salvia miltiorrhiza TaxID=226208 RepID=UPI0025AD594C|nr:GPI-anchored protein LLG3-like [Salvia miltiorrhiza]
MDSNKSLLHLFLFFLVVGIASSSHISNGIFEPHRSIGRSLLQQKSSCAVDFENMNYTVITSQCKGPNYSAGRCCPPLKQLLCPVKDQINDLKSDCADVFFSYVNLYGKYPPGLFASLCKEGEAGLDCKGVNVSKNGAACAACSSYLVMIIAALAFMLFCIV